MNFDLILPLLAVNLSPFHDPLLQALLPLLADPKPLSVRKRAYMALCTYSVMVYNLNSAHHNIQA